ncbi:CAP domain-containing protein [Cohnella mopanensis]|uniref:CAP domain-containing protein n=1 Tax=Cohnella mopanensis TaxID=2911966 RepID=UPI001EF7CB05|nr:CAP domain-containing protein [Cohnella mopanensis]
MKRKLVSIAMSFALLLSLALSSHSVQAFAASSANTESGLPVRTAQEIFKQWKKLMVPSGPYADPFLTEPSISIPYEPGTLDVQYIQDGVNAVNFYRFISGLTYDVVSTADLNVQAQYGSVLLASEGNFSHTPAKPADMPKDFFDKGYKSTSSSNIYASYGYDDHIVSRSIDAYMEDSDKNNLAVLGHRRWILNPLLKKIGIGLANGEDEWSYSALQVFDQSRSKASDYNYVAYPAQGAFPVEVFGSHYAWSVSLNMEKFKKPVKKNVKVSIQRLRDNRTWKLNSMNDKVTERGAYLNVENNPYGSGSAIIFRPGGIDEYLAGDRYTVTILGLQSKDGSDQPLSYTVNFMSVTK